MSQLMDALQAAEALRREKARQEPDLSGQSSPDDGWEFTLEMPSAVQQDTDAQPPQEAAVAANVEAAVKPPTEQPTPDLSWNPNLDDGWLFPATVPSAAGLVAPTPLPPQDVKVKAAVDAVLDAQLGNPNQEPRTDLTFKPSSLSSSSSSMFLDLLDDEEQEEAKESSRIPDQPAFLPNTQSSLLLSAEEEVDQSPLPSKPLPTPSSSMFLELPDDEEEEGQEPSRLPGQRAFLPNNPSRIMLSAEEEVDQSPPSAEVPVRSLHGAEVGQGTEEAFAENLQTLMSSKKRAKRVQRYHPVLVGGGVMLLLSIVSAGYFLNEMLEPEESFRVAPRADGLKPPGTAKQESAKESKETALKPATNQQPDKVPGSVAEQPVAQQVAQAKVEKPVVTQPQPPVAQTPTVPAPVAPPPVAPAPVAPPPVAPPPVAPPPVAPPPVAPVPVAPPPVAPAPVAPVPVAPVPVAPVPVAPVPIAPAPIAPAPVAPPPVAPPPVAPVPVAPVPVAPAPVAPAPVAPPPVAPAPVAPPSVAPFPAEPPAISLVEKGDKKSGEETARVVPSGTRMQPAPREQNRVAVPIPGMTVLDQASQAFRQGNLDHAKHLFNMVLKTDPRSHHAMIGLASVSVRRGDSEEARFWYQRVLREDPHNSLAATALLGLNGSGNTASDESQLKHLLRTNPGASHLHFALGNVYAAQQRWTLAFSAYSDANHLSQEKNPEVLCNLATTLDHLRRWPEALVYYQKALEIVEYRPNMRVAFDVEAVRRRVEVLRMQGGQRE